MYWLSRPPYWRWLLATLIVCGAVYMDLSGPAAEEYPFVAASADAGEAVTVEWRTIPRGILPAHGPIDGITSSAVPAGTPVVPGLLTAASAVPDDWWAIPTPLPPHAVVGSHLLVALHDRNLEVPGIVMSPASEGSFGARQPGLAAFPAAEASVVAVALAEQRATILVRP